MKRTDRPTAYIFLWLVLGGIVYLRRSPEAPVVPAPPGRPFPEFSLDLNSASWERLTVIAGVGESLARRIVAARETRGGFTTLREVMDLPGVPDRPFEEARPYLKLGPRSKRLPLEESATIPEDETRKSVP